MAWMGQPVVLGHYCIVYWQSGGVRIHVQTCYAHGNRVIERVKKDNNYGRLAIDCNVFKLWMVLLWSQYMILARKLASLDRYTQFGFLKCVEVTWADDDVPTSEYIPRCHQCDVSMPRSMWLRQWRITHADRPTVGFPIIQRRVDIPRRRFDMQYTPAFILSKQKNTCLAGVASLYSTRTKQPAIRAQECGIFTTKRLTI